MPHLVAVENSILFRVMQIIRMSEVTKFKIGKIIIIIMFKLIFLLYNTSVSRCILQSCDLQVTGREWHNIYGAVH